MGYSMVVMDDKLYVAGGDYKICASYNIATDVWSTLNSPNCAHLYGPLVCDNNKLFLLAGRAAVEEHDLEKQVWMISDFKEHALQQLWFFYAFVVDMPQ